MVCLHYFLDGGVSTNHISRAEPNGIDLPSETISYGDGKGMFITNAN